MMAEGEVIFRKVILRGQGSQPPGRISTGGGPRHNDQYSRGQNGFHPPHRLLATAGDPLASSKAPVAPAHARPTLGEAGVCPAQSVGGMAHRMSLALLLLTVIA